MRVLGIDPGTRHLGWGVLDQEGTRVRHVAHGVIDTDTSGAFGGRLVEIDDALIEVLATHRPDVAVVEAIFFAKDAQAASKLGHARGVVLLRLTRAGLRIFEYPPTRVKRAVVGAGLASKEQVAQVMTRLLNLPSPPRPDAADALANAFAHTTMSRYTALLEASVPAPVLAALQKSKRRVGRRPPKPKP